MVASLRHPAFGIFLAAAVGLCGPAVAATLTQMAQATQSPSPTPSPTPTPSGPAAECEKLAAPAPPYATLAMIKAASFVNKNVDHLASVCEDAVKAEPGNARLQFLLGKVYDYQKRYPEAAHLYSLAAEAGDADAMTALGVLIIYGRGQMIDKQRAFDLFSKAAALGNPGAMGDLGSMYSSGFAVKRDDAQALAWYEKSIDAGSAFALAQTAVMFYDGKGVPRDYQTAAQYFQQAADLDDGYSLKFLAAMYEHGLLGPPDAAKAAELRLKAAQVDPNSLTPDVKFAVARPPQRTAGVRRRVVHYYRAHTFFGVCLVYPC